VNIATIKTATVSLRGDALTIGGLRELVRQCDAAKVPDAGTVALQPVSGGTSASITWTAGVTSAPEAEAAS